MKKYFICCLIMVVLLALVTSCVKPAPDVSDSANVPGEDSSVGDTPPIEDKPEHIHNFSDWSVVQNPTCTESGEKARYCSCGERQAEIIPNVGHTEVIDEAIEPTCTETGLTEGKHCSVCDEILVSQKLVDAKGHTEVIDKAVDATCTETGLTEGKHCSVCDEILVSQKLVDARGHTEVIDKAVDATCTETGLTEGKHCSVCDEIIVEQGTTPKTSHTYDDKYDESCNKCGFIRDAECAHVNTTTLSAVAATCTQAGLTEGEVCAKCEEIIVAQTVVPAKGHTEVIDEAVEPTCTESGLTEGKHCGVCNTVILAQALIDAKGHTEVIDEAVEPTCTESGLTEGKHCGVCNTVIVAQTLIDAGHTEVIDSAVAPTCTEPGLTEGKHCGVCNTVIVGQTVIESNGHSFENRICTVCGEKIYSEGLLFSSNGDGTCSVKVGTCTDTYIIIPPVSPEGDSVTTIWHFAFDGCTSLTSVVIPDSVTTIGAYAFQNCTMLTNITIPDSVTSIREYAFSGCSGLTGVNIFDIAAWCNIEFYDVTSNPLYYAKNLYHNGKLVTELLIPDGVKAIGNYAFYRCTSIESVVIPKGVTSIGMTVFYDCDNLISVEIPDSVTSMSNNTAFLNCAGLTYNEYDNAYYLGNKNNPHLVLVKAKSKDVTSCTIHENTKFIHAAAFNACRSLTSVEIPDCVKSIGWCAFSCSDLVSVSFGNDSQLSSIGPRAFEDCWSLISITIPNSVTSVSEDAFDGCVNLKHNEYGNAYYLGNEKNPYVILRRAKSTEITSCNIHKDTKILLGFAFEDCTSLTSIVIPNGITSIENHTFLNCTSLTSVVIPGSVTSIALYAFNYTPDDVYYVGTAEEWAKIDNKCNLTTATIHYNYIPEN